MTRLLRNYLWRRSLTGFATVTASLAAVLWLLELLQGLERAEAGLIAAAWQAARATPESLVDLLPLVTVLATTLVLGAMQRDHELTIIRAAGIGWTGIARMAAVPALAAALLGLAFLQVAAPSLEQASKRLTGASAAGGSLWSPGHGLWARSVDGDRFLNVRRLDMGRIPADIGLYHYRPDGELLEMIEAEQAVVEADGRWRLRGIRIRRFDAGDPIASETRESMLWQPFLEPEQFELLIQPPGSLPPSELWRYLRALADNDQDNARYRLLFWQRISLPIACLGMSLIALVAVAGSPRASRTALRAMLAGGLGIAYQLLVELTSFAGLATGIPATTLAWLPPVLLVALAATLVVRADSAGNG